MDPRPHPLHPLGSTRLTLRSDLIFSPQTSDDQTCYIVEDPIGGRYFRLGLTEYTFVSLLDGRRTASEALAEVVALQPDHRLTETDAAKLCRWLVEMDLAHSPASSSGARLAESAARADRRRQLQRLNPLYCRLPLGDPSGLLRVLAPWLSWIFAPQAALPWTVLIMAGGYAVLSDWERFTTSSQGIFAPDNWLWITACWIVLKVVHELGHGLACHRHGGSAREIGVAFVFGAPLAYVDVTSCWRFRSPRARIAVALAGMQVELAIAATAALIWSCTDSGWLNNLCYNLVVMASVATLLFNANPLMKFDGYYVLSDALGIPNLYTSGQHSLRHWARRYLLGLPSTLPDRPRHTQRIISLYGWASFVWRVCVCLTLMAAAATLFHGAGIVLAACAVVLWVGVPSVQLVKYLVHARREESPSPPRCLLVACGAVSLVVAFWLAPWPGARAAPAVIEYAPHTVVRAASGGFVQQIEVRGGQHVQAGQLLVVLENHQLQRELADLRLQIEQSEVRGRQHEQRGEFAQQQAEADRRAGLIAQAAENQARVDRLLIHAPRSGTVIGRSLAALRGTYVDEGDALLSLGEETRKELRISVGQDDVDEFGGHVGRAVWIDVPHQPRWQGQLEKLIPRASRQPPHAALVAANGGPLATRLGDSSQPSSEPAAYELLAPRFTATVQLTAEDSSRLRSGQTARVGYRGYDESIGQHLYHSFQRWLRNCLTRQPRTAT